MFYVYHGKNIHRRQQALGKLREGLLQKRPEAEVFEIDADTFSVDRIEELTVGRGLFEEKYIVFLFHVLSTDHGQEALLERLEALGTAEHIFILIEDEVKKTHLKKLEKHAEATQEFAGKGEGEEYKPFPLSDAYGRRDKRGAWIELQKAREANQRAESVHGILAWQTRLMLLAKECKTADEAGVSAYPFKKAKNFGRNFSAAELADNMQQLVWMYHNAHRGRYDLHDAMEQFLLEI
ncbi:MAG: hypothetical protein WD335_00420 [Candidatus Paceibacterota bacterium]